MVEAMGVEVAVDDGHNIASSYETMQNAIDRVRTTGAPSFLEFSTYRWREHCGPSFDDQLNYRSNSEIEVGLARCPVARFETYCRENILKFDVLKKGIHETLDKEIETAFKFARNGERPSLNSAFGNIYA
jgi:pyruvate dehydrogenase E1 component alpha subunit